MATIRRTPLVTPISNWRAARDQATFAAAIVGIFTNTITQPLPNYCIFQNDAFQFDTFQECPPFAQENWPNPLPVQPRASPQSFVQGTPQTLRPAVAAAAAPFAETDWPNPQRVAARPVDLLTQTGTSTPLPLAGVVQPPFAQNNWPLPIQRIYRQFDLTTWTQNYLQTTLGPPFAQRSWPNPLPPQPARQADSEGFNSAILDYAVGLNTANKRQYDWPNPRGPLPARQADCEGFSASILSYADGLNTANRPRPDWPNPRGPARSVDALTWTLQNLQQSTLPPTAVPFFETDWPVPKGAADRSFAQAGTQGASPGALLPPFYETDWPVPKAAARGNQDWAQGFPAPLRDFAGGLNDGKWRNLDWPNPRGAVPNQPLSWTQNLTETPFTSPPVQALVQRDWPNPSLGKPPLNVGWASGFPQPILDYAVGLNNGLWRNLDWPNPRGPQRSIDALTWTQSLSLPRATPFEQADWPVPIGAAPRPVQDGSKGFALTVLDYAVGLNTGLGIQRDWPVPRGPQRSIDALTWTQSLALQITAAGTKPFQQSDWPLAVPRVYRQIADTTGFPEPILDYAVGLNAANKRQYDWPNPRGPQRSIDALTWTQSFSLSRATPFAQADWPVPKGVPPRPDFVIGFPAPIRDYAVGLNTGLGQQRDWPNPRGPARSIDALTWTQTLALTITAQSVKPFIQSDWPLAVPRVYRQIADTVGFTTPIRGYAVGLNAANKRKYDWPNPTGRPPLNVGWASGFPEPINDAQRLRPGLRQYDWPVPKGKQPYTKDWVFGPPKILTTVFPKPFAQTSWPVPPGYEPVAFDWVFSDVILRIPAPVIPPEPVPPTLAKHSHGHVASSSGEAVLITPFSRGVVRTSRTNTSSRWRKSRGRIRTSKAKTTPRDDP